MFGFLSRFVRALALRPRASLVDELAVYGISWPPTKGGWLGWSDRDTFLWKGVRGASTEFPPLAVHSGAGVAAANGKADAAAAPPLVLPSSYAAAAGRRTPPPPPPRRRRDERESNNNSMGCLFPDDSGAGAARGESDPPPLDGDDTTGSDGFAAVRSDLARTADRYRRAREAVRLFGNY